MRIAPNGCTPGCTFFCDILWFYVAFRHHKKHVMFFFLKTVQRGWYGSRSSPLSFVRNVVFHHWLNSPLESYSTYWATDPRPPNQFLRNLRALEHDDLFSVTSKKKHVKLPKRGFSELLFGVGQKKYLQKDLQRSRGKKKKHDKNQRGIILAPLALWVPYKGVSKNRGSPKWMVYNGKPY